METKDTDILLRDFFGQHKLEIADNGFSKRVMHQLPEQTDYSWIVWVFTAIATSITLFLGFQSGFFLSLFTSLFNSSIYYFIAAIVCFPLIGGSLLLLSKKPCCQLI